MKHLIIILAVLFSISLKGQQRFPTGFPTQANLGWNKWGYAMSDSGLIVANRDTNWLAKYSGTVVFKPSNKKFYWFDSTTLTWNKFADAIDTTSMSNRINLKLNISDTSSMLSPYLRKVDTTNKWVQDVYVRNDSLFKFKNGTEAFIDTLGGGGGGSGTVTSVGLSLPSAFNVTPSSITTSGTFAVTGAGTTSQYIRGNGTLATTDTGMIPNFHLKVRSLFSGSSPITFSQVTGIIGINNANTTGTKGAASFTTSFSDNGSGVIDLADLVSAGSCSGCILNIDAKGRITSYSTGAGGATNNTNVGSGFRPVNEGTQEMRTYFAGFGNRLDSVSNTNGLTWSADTTRSTGLPTYFYIDSSLANYIDTVYANNGLSNLSDSIQLGQAVSAVGNPAALHNDREIPLNGFRIGLSGTGSFGVGTNAPSLSYRMTVVGTGSTAGINVSTATATGINVSSTNTGISSFSSTGTAVNASTSGGAGNYAVVGGGGIGGTGGRFHTTFEGGDASPVVLELERFPTGAGVTNGAGFTIMFKNAFTSGATGNESGRITNYFSNAVSGSQTSAFGFHLVNNAVSARKALLAGSGQWTWDGYPALTPQTDTTNIKPIGYNTSTGLIEPMANWVGSGGGGSGIDYVYSATAPTGTDTMKLWVKTPDFCGVNDVMLYVVNTGWRRFGWLSIDGVLSFKPPLNAVIAGQSNAAGTDSGGDTAYVPGIIVYTSGVENTGLDAPTHWASGRIGLSPFYLDNNNIAWAFAKEAKRNGTADIIRIIGTYEGGQGMKRWIDSAGVNTHYLLDTLRARLTRSGIDTLHAFLWHHGESGGVASTANGGYYTDLTQFLDTLYSPLTPAYFKEFTRFIAGGLGTDTMINQLYNGATPSGASQRLMQDRRPLTAYTPSWLAPLVDHVIHFSGVGLDTMGRRYHATYKNMPRNLWDEDPKYTYDYVADKIVYPTRTVAYNNGVTGSNIQGITLGYFNNTTPIFTLDGSNNVTTIGNFGSWSFTGNPTLKVVGTMGLITGSNSLRIAGNYNVTGTDLRNTIVANYNTNYNRAASTTSDNVLIGNDAGYTTTKDLANSVMIGSDAGEFIAGGGAGDFFTFVGKSAGRNSNSRYTTFIGAATGDSTRGTSTTIVGYNSRGSVAATTYDSSSAFGANARITKSHQVVLGDTTLQEIKIGKLPFQINSTPSDGQYYAYNNANGQFELTAAPSSGITTLNSLTAATQTFATGTSGTDFNISSSVSTHTFNLPSASTVNRGLITTGAQSFAGIKDFTDAVDITDISRKGKLILSGDISMSSSPGIGGLGLILSSFTYTDGSGAGSDANGQYFHKIDIPTLSATNARTYSGNTATLFLTGVPIADGSATVSHPYNIFAQDVSRIDVISFKPIESNTDISISGAPTENGSFLVLTGSGGNTWTLPSLVTHPGKVYLIKNASSGNLTVQRSGSDNIYDTSSVTSVVVAAGGSVKLVAGASFWYVLN